LMHLVSCYLLQDIFAKLKIRFGEFGIIIFALAPFNFEAVYWISASTRIVIGLFVCLLSVKLLIKYIEKRNNKMLLAAFLLNLLAMGFYEQIIVFNLFIACFVLFLKRKEVKNRLIFFIPFVSMGIIGIYYAYFIAKFPDLARAQARTTDYLTQAKTVIRSIFDIAISAQFYSMITTFKDGVITILHNNSYIYLALVAVLSILLYTFFTKDKISLREKRIKQLLTGILFFIVPFIPFFILNYYYIANRNVFLSMIGIAVLLEVIYSAVFNNRAVSKLKGLFIVLTVVILVIMNISEVNNYKKINETDNAIAKEIITVIGQENIKEENSLYLFNTRYNYVQVSSSTVASSCSSDWGLMGLMQVQMGKVAKMKVYCTPDKQNVKIDTGNNYFVGIDENNKVVILKRTAEKQDIMLNQEDGQRFGVLKITSSGSYTFERG
jgi:hypothetical protein